MYLMIILTLIFIAYIVLKMFKDRLMTKMAFRNIFRRKIDTALIIIGSCIGTALITGAFSMNDSMESFIYSQINQRLGETDEIVEKSVYNKRVFFDIAEYENFLEAIRTKEYTDGILPIVSSKVMIGREGAIRNPLSNNSREVLLLSAEPKSVSGFGSEYTGYARFDSYDGEIPGIVIHENTAKALNLKIGDQLELLTDTSARFAFWNDLTKVAVIEILPEQEMLKYFDDSSSNLMDRIFIPEKYVRTLLKLNPGFYNSILISNKGDYLRGNEFSEAVEEEFYNMSYGEESHIRMEKKNSLKNSENNISGWMFFALSSFTIIAGLLLLSNIYTMLVEERQVEMGTLRAIGFNRKKVNSLIIYEGFFYSLISSFFGVVAGIFISMYILNRFSGVITDIGDVLPKNLPFDVEIPAMSVNFSISFSSVFLSLLIGFALPMIVIILNGRKISNMNIVKAVRGIVDTDDISGGVRKKRMRMVFLAVASIFFAIGLAGNSILFFIGSVMLLSSIGTLFPPKYSRAAITLSAFSIIAFSLFFNLDYLIFSNGIGSPELRTIIFTILKSLSILFSILFIVVYNLRLFEYLLKKIMIFLKGSPAVIKVSIAFPARNTRKTAFTIAMYTIVMFVITIFSIIPNSETEMIRRSDNSLFLGYDVVLLSFPFIESDVPNIYLEQIEKMEETELFTQVTIIPSIFKNDMGTFAALVIGVEDDFKLTDGNIQLIRDTISYRNEDALNIFNKSIAEENSDTVVNLNMPAVENGEKFLITGISADNFSPHMTYQMNSSGSNAFELEITPNIKVISDNLNLYSGIMMNKSVIPQEMIKSGYRISMIALKGGNEEEIRSGYEKISKFIQNKGLFAIFTGDIIKLAAASIMGFTDILRSFLYFGLFVGITGIAIIMFKALFKRRRLIGMMKAIGFTRKMVFISFIFETSFVVILGILIGLFAGTITSSQFLEIFKEIGFKINMEIPYALLFSICLTIYGISFLVTLIPSVLASRIPPADALRYFE